MYSNHANDIVFGRMCALMLVNIAFPYFHKNAKGSSSIKLILACYTFSSGEIDIATMCHGNFINPTHPTFGAMELRKALLSITAIVIVVLFMEMAMQPATAHSNERTFTVSVKQQVEYNRYFIQKPINVSDRFSNAFVSWYLNREHANPYVGGKVSAFRMPSQSQVKELFPIFLKQNPDAVKLMNQLTASENARFQKENHEMGMRFIRSLKNGSKIPKVYEYSTNNSKFVAVNIAHPMYSGGFPTSTGEYVMVSMNYYSIPMWYPGPWWAPWQGHCGSINYGEHDTINILYVSSDAQTWYDQENSKLTSITEWTILGSFILLGASYLAGVYGLSASASAIVAAIPGIVAILTAMDIAVAGIVFCISLQLSAMYQSTYANPLNGESKFLWTYYSIDYFYPWTLVTLASLGLDSMAYSFTWDGYTNKGTVSMLPYIPVASNNPAFVVVSGALSGEAHGIAGKIGWNSWGTES